MGIEKLSRREKEILECIASGVPSKELAYKLFISDQTLKNHRSHIINKLEASNMAHAVAMLYEDKLKNKGE